MAAKLNKVRIVVASDPDGDASWLEQEGWEDRLAAYRNGDFGFVGLQVEAEILIPYGKDWITQTITSPGLWSIEDDSGEDYLRSVATDEACVLNDMLREFGMDQAVNGDVLEAPIVWR